MKLFSKSHDGGKDSGVTGYWLIEWKPGISIVILRFSKGSREAYHSHAFNAYTWWLKGRVVERVMKNGWIHSKEWFPSVFPKHTPRHLFHKIDAKEVSWAISIRGPWKNTWKEYRGGKVVTLTHGRVEVENASVVE